MDICGDRILQVNRKFRPLTESSLNDFHLALEGLSWDFVRYKTVGTNDAFQDFQNAFMGCYRTAFSEREVNDGRCTPGLDWYTEELRSMTNDLNPTSELYDKYKTEPLRKLRNRLKPNYKFDLNKAKIQKL
ncbi:hypothetical protein HHI36_022433 [Cryptolaemus montrouzieri]|uniref:Uncharacterized protein n=1 Tax=Cryptolaemus montrouzieri TaxID=559131 RepID=A0ABD2MZZ2_9CUCU